MARRKLFTIGYEQTPSKAVLDELEAARARIEACDTDARAIAIAREKDLPNLLHAHFGNSMASNGGLRMREVIQKIPKADPIAVA